MNPVYCGSQSLLGIEAIIFDKDGTLADSAPFLKRLAEARSQRCAEAVLAHLLGKTSDPNPATGRGEVSSPDAPERPPTPISPSDLVDRLMATLGVWDHGIDPDGLMAAGTRQSNIDALVEVLLGLEVFSESDQSEIQTLVAEQCDLADQDLNPKTRYTPPFPGTQAMLQRLSQSGLKLGVLSSDSPAHVEDFLTRYDLMPWINDCQGTAPADPPKPAPDLLYRLCERMGVAVAQTVVVGDSWVDQALAQNAGVPFISVSEAWGRPPVAGAAFVLTAWEDLHLRPHPRPS